MKITLAVLIAVVLSLVIVEVADRSPRNLASADLTVAEPDAHCISLYNDVGLDHVYATTCRMPDKSVLRCTESLKDGFKCTALVGGQRAPQPAPAPTTAQSTQDSGAN